MNLDRYEIVKELGSGTCGQSFLARDKRLPSNRLCVIKQLKPKTNDPATYKLIRDRFMVEARVLEKLGRVNDQIPELFELIIQDDDIYLIQEWIEGVTLRQRLQEVGQLNLSEVKEIVSGVLTILSFLYYQGVIHRDINPSNIILRHPDGKPILIDFGVVKEVLTTITDSHGEPTGMSIIAGTNGYMSPEQILGKPVFASDLFSLGRTAIHLLTGKHPVELDDPATGEFQWREYAPNVPDDFAAILDKAIHESYRKRYSNAKEMLDELLPVIKKVPDMQMSGTYETIENTNPYLEYPQFQSIKEPISTIASPAEAGSTIDLAVEINSYQTLIYRKDYGIVVSEPSIVAINKRTKSVEAVGREAEQLSFSIDGIHNVTNDVVIYSPIVDAKVADRELAEKLLRHLLLKACGGDSTIKSRVVIAIPSTFTQDDRRTLTNVTYRANATEVYLAERIVCAANEARNPNLELGGRLVVHVGESAVEIMGVSFDNRSFFSSYSVAEGAMKEAITDYIKRKYNLLIGERTAEQIVIELGSAFPLDEPLTREIHGRNFIEGIPKTIAITDGEVREALSEPVASIVIAVRMALERLPPELTADLVEQGIVLTGGGALLKNLAKRLSIETGLPVSLADDPLLSVLRGAVRYLSRPNVRSEERLAVSRSQSTAKVLLNKWFNLFSHDLAVDLGTSSTLIYAKNQGIVVSEPSIVAVSIATNHIDAYGRDAKEMIGRTYGGLVPIRPLDKTVIVNSEIAGQMLRHFISKLHDGRKSVSPRVVIPTRSGLSKVQLESFVNTAYSAGAFEVYLVEEPIVAAMGAGLPIAEPFGNMIVDLGGGRTDIAVISLSEIVLWRAVPVAGNEMDEAISQYIKRKYNLLIGERTAEAIKIELGSAFPLDDALSMEVRGRNVIEGIPKSITITDSEVREALADCLASIVNGIRIALEMTPPELATDIFERGIVLTGGGAFLRNLDRRISIETGLPVSISDDPLAAIVLGTGKLLSDLRLLEKAKWIMS